jgi:hypothetical protein
MNLRSIFWSVCRSISPDLHLTLKSILGARRSRATERRLGQIGYTSEFIRRFGPAVLNGPFKGLKFPPAAFGHNLVPKLMGVYELQLHAAVEAAISRRPAHVIDIGAAEGYYAAGFALRLPQTQVHAFDAAPVERSVCKQVAAENGLRERVEVSGICTVSWLQNHLQPGDLVFSDCEGGEDSLLDPVKAPALRKCDLLIETHDQAISGITERLIERFCRTHEITRLQDTVAPPEMLPVIDSWTAQDYMQALDDGRTADQDWLVLTARDHER